MLILSNIAEGAGDPPGRWHLDEGLVAEVSLVDGTLAFRVINSGTKARTINAGLADEKYLAANVVRVRLRAAGDPRGRIETFRIAGDGVIGLTSEFFPVKSLEIKPGDAVETKVALATALKQLAGSNEAVGRWRQGGDGAVCITLAVAFRDIGIQSNAGVELVCPWVSLVQAGK
jgi:hypothetical protein